MVGAARRTTSRASCGCTTAATAGPAARDYKRAENRWFDHWLFGVHNGITREPRVHDPARGRHLPRRGRLAPPRHAHDALRLAALRRAPSRDAARRTAATQSFVDRGRELDTDDVLITRPRRRRPEPARLPHARRSPAPRALSGTPWVDPADVDRQPRRREPHRRARRLRPGHAGDGHARLARPAEPQRIAAQQPGPPRPRVPTSAGTSSPTTTSSRPATGSASSCVSTDHDYTLRPLPGTRLTLDPGASRLRLPIVRSTISATGG